MKNLLFLLLLPFYVQAQDAYNPFEAINKNSQTTNLSQGKYEELYADATYKRIGDVIFNTKTNKIEKFLEPDDTTTLRKNDQSTRWLSIDPLAAKYPSLSPYNFVNNMPIWAIDPDGREIWISNGKHGKDNVIVQYKDGKIYSKNGKEIDFTNATGNTDLMYFKKVQGSLLKLQNSDKVIDATITHLEESTHKHLINPNSSDKNGPDRSLSDPNNKKGSGSVTNFSYNSKNTSGIDPETILIHELRHAYDEDTDQGEEQAEDEKGNKLFITLKDKKGKITYKPLKVTEINAVNLENRYRFKKGYKIRTDYSGTKIPDNLYKDPKEKP